MNFETSQTSRDPVAKLRVVQVYRQRGGPTTCLGSLADIQQGEDGCEIAPYQEVDREPIVEALRRDRYLVLRCADRIVVK